MKTILSIAAALLVICVFAGCAASDTASVPRTVSITQANNNGFITLNKGDTLTVTLDGNPTTGYRWEYVAPKNAVLSLLGDPQFEPATTSIGSPGKMTLTFQAGVAGEQNLELVYHRSFEKNNPPAATFKAKVVVK